MTDDRQHPAFPNPADQETLLRNHRLASRVEAWSQEDDGEDAVIGPLLDATLRANPIRCREAVPLHLDR